MTDPLKIFRAAWYYIVYNIYFALCAKDRISLFDLIFSPPQLSFGPRQYIDEDGDIREDAPYNGDPSNKRNYLEKFRPIDWLQEWHKTPDMREVGDNQSLLRGGRFRFFNGIIEDIMIEEVQYDVFFNS